MNAIEEALDKAWDAISGNHHRVALEHLHGACKEVADLLRGVTAADLAAVSGIRREISKESASRVLAERTLGALAAWRRDEAAVQAALQWAGPGGKSDSTVTSVLSLHRMWTAGGRISENDGDVAARILANEVMRLRRLTECPFRSDLELSDFLGVPVEVLRTWTDAQVLQAHGWKLSQQDGWQTQPPEHLRPYVTTSSDHAKLKGQ